MCEVGRIVYRLVVDLDDHIPGTESGLFPAAAFFHRAHQHAFAVLDPKEVSQLRGKVFHHQPAAQRRVDDDHRDGHVEVRHRGDLRHVELEFAALWRPSHRLVPVGKLHLDRQGLTVAADAEIHHAARWRFFNHPAQLGSTLYRRAVQAYDDVMLVQPGLSGGSVLVDHRDLRAVLFLELQFSQPLRRNVSDIHSEIRRSAALLRAVTPVPALAGAIVVQFRGVRTGDQRKEKYAKQEAIDHKALPNRVTGRWSLVVSKLSQSAANPERPATDDQRLFLIHTPASG